MRLEDGQVVIFFGDSITRASFGSNYITSLRQLLVSHAEEMKCTLINAGEDGDTIDNLLMRVHNDVLARRPDWVVVLVGINDVFYSLMFADNPYVGTEASGPAAHADVAGYFRDHYAQLVDVLKGSVPNVVLCTTTIIEDAGVQIRERLAIINDTIRSLAEEKECHLVELNLTFLYAVTGLREKNGDGDFLLTYDGVHLNQKGAELVAMKLFEFFTED